jgi:hypothetical protein
LHDSALPTLPNHATSSNAGGVTAGSLALLDATGVPTFSLQSQINKLNQSFQQTR